MGGQRERSSGNGSIATAAWTDSPSGFHCAGKFWKVLCCKERFVVERRTNIDGHPVLQTRRSFHGSFWILIHRVVFGFALKFIGSRGEFARKKRQAFKVTSEQTCRRNYLTGEGSKLQVKLQAAMAG